jgi:hypothetical protein
MATLERRFWSKVDKTPECWRWTASTFRTGRGQFRVGSRNRQAHLVAWELTFGAPPLGLLRSACGNLLCVRPDHQVVVDRKVGATNLARTPVKRFEAMVRKGPQCWDWIGSTVDGYGQFGFQVPGYGRQMIPAHRYAWERASGAIPDGVDVLPLVRESHLCAARSSGPAGPRGNEQAANLPAVADPQGLVGPWHELEVAHADCCEAGGAPANRHDRAVSAAQAPWRGEHARGRG